PDRRRLEGEVLHIRPREEDVARHRQRDVERDERDHDAVVADDGDVEPADEPARPLLQRRLGRGHYAGTLSAANAACGTASSLIVVSSNSATTRPARMTSTRCARPSTSSCSDEMRSTAIPCFASEWIRS